MKYLTKEERESLESFLRERLDHDLRNALLLLVALCSGARASEIIDLQWEHVDFENLAIHFKTLKRYKRKASDSDAEAEAKREASAERYRRPVPLPKYLFGALKTLREAYPLKPFGISYSRFGEIWRTYRQVKKPLHCLRHTCAISAYDETPDVIALKALLGHASIKSTMVYADRAYGAKELRKIFKVR